MTPRYKSILAVAQTLAGSCTGPPLPPDLCQGQPPEGPLDKPAPVPTEDANWVGADRLTPPTRMPAHKKASAIS